MEVDAERSFSSVRKQCLTRSVSRGVHGMSAERVGVLKLEKTVTLLLRLVGMLWCFSCLWGSLVDERKLRG